MRGGNVTVLGSSGTPPPQECVYLQKRSLYGIPPLPPPRLLLLTPPPQERSMLVQFITGSSKVPLGGFKDLQGMHGTQRFNIHRTADPARLPSAHTWSAQSPSPKTHPGSWKVGVKGFPTPPPLNLWKVVFCFLL